jgi:hypothetical protein
MPAPALCRYDSRRDIGSILDDHRGRGYSGVLPRYFYEGKDVCAVDGSLRCGLFDRGQLTVPNRLVTDKKSSVQKMAVLAAS